MKGVNIKDEMLDMPMWTLEIARVVVKELQPQAWALHWNLCMGGGVVNNGSSDNDFDVVAIPMNLQAENAHVLALFTNSGWKLVRTSNLSCATWHQLEMDGRIIELLVMKCGQK